MMQNSRARNTYYEELFLYLTIAILFYGFIAARAYHGLGLVFMGVICMLNKEYWLGVFKQRWFLSFLGLAMIVPIYDLYHSGSIDLVFLNKLSLPFYVLFFFSCRPTEEQSAKIGKIVCVILALLSIYTLIQEVFVKNVDLYQLYKVAKVLKIGTYSDHIRISIAIALSCIWAWKLFMKERSNERYLYVIYAVFQILFLHFLSARTGLVVLYLSHFILLFYLLIKVKQKQWAVIGILCMLCIPLVSYFIFPSFHQRVEYSRYDMGQYMRQEYREGSSDGLRYYSLVAGLKIFKENLFTGVGFKNLKASTYTALKKAHPTIRNDELIQPSSELLIYSGAAGIVGLLVLILHAIVPFWYSYLLKNMYFMSVFLSLIATFLFEILLENQFGTFVYGFFISIFWWMAKKEGLESNLNN
jgi:O-antigen ligase